MRLLKCETLSTLVSTLAIIQILGTILARFFELDSIFKNKIHDYVPSLLPNTYYTQIEILKIAFTGVCGNSFLPNPVLLFMDRNGGAVEPFITLVDSYPFATFLCTPKEIQVKVIFVTYSGVAHNTMFHYMGLCTSLVSIFNLGERKIFLPSRG